ncbi:putative ubiquitin carboxyl-terminal hydrolase isozyme l3 [Phaeomoniella chlamydospora]|uniref:Ubiquitin carboxyl-terminal hydrolase n=1 Tax=Phaeomoniella chlamydospora TaxID=158046 RepID=A0A0G2EUK2_PHACM|nr:putative ubiquitin carboxyl-terminal hydrolase isozyme l3 [Phaeomoniella chlamydospora]
MADVDVSAANKAFVPLENNPEVMSSLVHTLGVSSSLAFHDVYSLDDPTMLSFVPRPASALLLVFPVTNTYETFRQSEDSALPEYSGSGASEPVIWFKQTIRNACGLIGLLHAVSNGAAKEMITEGSDLDKLLKDAIPLSPKDRADLLYESKALESAHSDAATRGDTKAPDAEDQTELHFVCFVKQGDELWELDGRRKGPLYRGKLAENEDVLSDKGLDLGVKSFLKREEEAGGGELRFSCIALGPSLD